MNVNELLVNYLKRIHGDTNSIVEFTKENALYFSTGNLFGIDVEKDLSYKINKFRYDYFVKRFLEIRDLFLSLNINTLLFKGIALANRLYDKAHKRYVGDIDVFVDVADFSEALTLLIRLGYNFRDEKTLYNEHHIVLIRDNVTVELHRSIFNPILGINENYLLNHLVPFLISSHTVQTFDITATLLHLIYHLYQDTYWSYHSLCSVLTSAEVPTTKRFLYRAYEIALFSEKYYNVIKWHDIANDLKHQKLRIFFKKMIRDIVAIFPNAFPHSYLQEVNDMTYIDDDHDVWCRRLLETDCFQENVDDILCSFIDDYWNKRADRNIRLIPGESLALSKPYIKDKSEDDANYKLTCNVSIETIKNDLKLTMKVSNHDCCFTAWDDYDTTASDGIHLMLFGTEKYSYNSIYIFPKIINGEARAIPVDVKRTEKYVIAPSLVNTTCEVTNDGYVVTVILTNKFLQENYLSKYLYMGLVVVDCSTKTRKRKAELILADTYSEWYNPVFYVKIDIAQ